MNAYKYAARNQIKCYSREAIFQNIVRSFCNHTLFRHGSTAESYAIKLNDANSRWRVTHLNNPFRSPSGRGEMERKTPSVSTFPSYITSLYYAAIYSSLVRASALPLTFSLHQYTIIWLLTAVTCLSLPRTAWFSTQGFSKSYLFFQLMISLFFGKVTAHVWTLNCVVIYLKRVRWVCLCSY